MENKEMEMMWKHTYAISRESLETLREVLEMLQDIYDTLEYSRYDDDKPDDIK